MPGLLGRANKRVTICLTLLVIGGIACVAVDRRWAQREVLSMVDPSAPVSGDLSRDLSAYDTVALRFPAELPDETGSLPALNAAPGMDGQRFNLFDPNPLTAPPSVGRSEPAPFRDAVPPPSSEIRMASAAPAKPAAHQTAHAALRPTGRPNAVLNDAQIATIKKRLKLTPDQEEMWPAVELALRNMSYSKKPQHGASSAAAKQLASIDPDGAEVQRLKSAAFPLLMSFNSEQKREVRTLVQVIGLEKLAAQF